MSKYRIGKRLKIVRVDVKDSRWKVGDTGVVAARDIRLPDCHCDLEVRMDTSRYGSRTCYGNDDNFVPLGKPPLLERIRLWFKRPSTDTTPGSWEGTGFDPNKTKEKEHGTENA